MSRGRSAPRTRRPGPAAPRRRLGGRVGQRRHPVHAPRLAAAAVLHRADPYPVRVRSDRRRRRGDVVVLALLDLVLIAGLAGLALLLLTT